MRDDTTKAESDAPHRLHLGRDLAWMIPKHGIDTAMKNKVLPIGFLQVDGVHASLNLQRIQGIKADLDQFGYEWIDISA